MTSKLGRPALPDGEKLVQLGVRIHPVLRDRVVAKKDQTGQSITDIVTTALEQYLDAPQTRKRSGPVPVRQSYKGAK